MPSKLRKRRLSSLNSALPSQRQSASPASSPALSVERVGIEQFEQHTEHLAGAAGRERKSSAIRQGDREDGVLRQFGQRFAVQRVGAGLEKLDQDRQQV